MTIAEQITRIKNAKTAIKEAIQNKGVAVNDSAKIDEYPALINSISGGEETHTNSDFYELRTSGGTNYNNLFRAYDGPDIDVSNWDTSKAISAKYCFCDCKKSFDISKWDLSSLTDANFMFQYYTNNNTYIDLSVLDFSKVSNVQYMFSNSNTDYLDVRNIKLTGTKEYNYLFDNCKGTELDLSSWDISNITSLSYTFNSCTHTKINLTGWKTTNVKTFTNTFYGYTTYLTHLIIPDWDMTNATNTSNFIYTSRSILKYVDLSRSNDTTISKIASFLPTKTATTYSEIVIPADTSQDVIDALLAKYWKPVGIYDLESTELVFELDEIKPDKTTKVINHNNNPWYGDDRDETIEFISSDESIATVNGREIRGVSEGTVNIICRRHEDGVVLGSKALVVSYTDSNPNLIKFRTNGSEGSNAILKVNGTNLSKSKLVYDSITNIYSYDPGVQITSIEFAGGTTYQYITEIIKFNFNAANITNASRMFLRYKGTTLDLSDWNTCNVTNFDVFINDSANIVEIKGELDLSRAEKIDIAFAACPNLETLYLKNICKHTDMTSCYNTCRISLSKTKIKDECLVYIINELPNLYDKGLDSLQINSVVLTLPQTNTLTEEQVQVAVNKGWQVANVTYTPATYGLRRRMVYKAVECEEGAYQASDGSRYEIFEANNVVTPDGVAEWDEFASIEDASEYYGLTYIGEQEDGQ